MVQSLSVEHLLKTQILQLESHDDVISTRDKMGWGKTGRILLVWPTRGRILTRRLDLVLLQRHSTTLGAQLALVTNDRDVRYYARQLRIPVFNSLNKAQSNRWRTYRRKPLVVWGEHVRPDLEELKEQVHPTEPSWIEKRPARLGLFSLSVLSFLIVVALFLPGAWITVEPRSETQEIALAISATQNNREVKLSGEVPAYLKSVIVEAKATIPTTGKVPAPEKFASGYVRFTNLTGQEVDIPLGTIVTTLATPEKASIRFATSDDGGLPAESGKTLALPVRALTPGAQGNLPVGSLVAIEGPLGLKVSVTNAVATSGGMDHYVSGPTTQNYEALYNQLSTSLADHALDELRLSLAPGDMPITTTVNLSQTLVKAFDPPPSSQGANLPADTLSLTLRQEYRVMVIAGQDLQILATQVLDARLPEGWLASGAPVITSLSAPSIGADGTIHYRVNAKREIQAQINEDQAVQMAIGRTPPQAATSLVSAFPLVNPPRISLAPGWWPYLPFLPFRISVIIE